MQLGDTEKISVPPTSTSAHAPGSYTARPFGAISVAPGKMSVSSGFTEKAHKGSGAITTGATYGKSGARWPTETEKVLPHLNPNMGGARGDGAAILRSGAVGTGAAQLGVPVRPPEE